MGMPPMYPGMSAMHAARLHSDLLYRVTNLEEASTSHVERVRSPLDRVSLCALALGGCFVRPPQRPTLPHSRLETCVSPEFTKSH